MKRKMKTLNSIAKKFGINADKKTIVNALVALGFKRCTKGLYKGEYVYNLKEQFSLHINFIENEFIGAQVRINAPSYIDAFFGYETDSDALLCLNIEPSNIGRVIPIANKAMRIVDSLNAKFSKIVSDIKRFGNLK